MLPKKTEVPDAARTQIGWSAHSLLPGTEIKPSDFACVDIHLLRLGLKRFIDVFGSVLLALCVAPVLISITLLLWMHGDRGSILFRQERIGRGGRPFTCLKFRSMCANADLLLDDLLARDEQARVEWATTHKLRNDPRVSKIGRFLRSTSIDELPQLWNIIRGDMSLVGPRPVIQEELDGPYTELGGLQHYLAVRPGLTGLWQVSGRSKISYESRVKFDKIYVRDLSLLRDALILWQTIYVVFRRDGAC